MRNIPKANFTTNGTEQAMITTWTRNSQEDIQINQRVGKWEHIEKNNNDFRHHIEFHLVCKFFFITVHKVNGEEYELDTLSGF